MNSFYTQEEAQEIGFKYIGKNVMISKYSNVYGATEISIGDNVRIDDFCILSGKISIGNYIHIAAYTALYGGTYGIEIQDYCNISSRNVIYALSDDFSGETMTNPMIPNNYKNIHGGKVILEKHVLIGSGCVVLPGVKLKEGTSFGAMSLINRDSERWTINAGVPFRKLKNRSKEILRLEKQFRTEKK